MKIGFLGGSFDPVHFGHLIVAQDVYEQCGLDRLYLVPAAQAPLKPQQVQSSVTDRLAMLTAVCADDARWLIAEDELKRGGVSYTIDTVRHFRSRFPDDELFWVIGADQVNQLPKWKDINELAVLVTFVYVERPGHKVELPAGIMGLRLQRCAGHLVDISSSELRQRVAAGRAIDYFCPQKVIAYIQDKKLYR